MLLLKDNLMRIQRPNKIWFWMLFKPYTNLFHFCVDKMVLLSDDTEDSTKLKDAFEELDQNWYLGMDSERGWRQAVLQEIPFLFGVSSVGAASEAGTFPKPLINRFQDS